MRTLLTPLSGALLISAIAAPVLCGPPTKAPPQLVKGDELPSDKADAVARASIMIERGLGYLRRYQKPDGSWQSENQPPAITAIVLRAFVLEPRRYNVSQPFIKKGYEKLLSYQQESGGIYKDMQANYNTAIAISALAAANNPEFQPAIDKAVTFLKSLQWNNDPVSAPERAQVDESNPRFGGWGYGSKERPDGSNLQIAIDALHDAGLKPEDPAFKNAIKFVSRMQNSSETNDQPWAGNDGGFIYSPSLGGESFAGEYVGPDGKKMFRSYGSMTYAGLKSFIYAGLSKDDPRVKAAWKWITENWTLSENPGMKQGDPANARWGLYYYYMTLARALNAYDQPTVTDPSGAARDWRVELINALAPLQGEEGQWQGDAKWMEDNPILTTSYCVLALQEALEDLKQHPEQAK